MTLYLTCQNVTKSYATRILFQDLSFSIFSEERVGLIGPNGSGKTTLLKILAGQERPNSGTLSFKRELKIGYVPQTCEFQDESPEKILIDAIQNDLPDYEKQLLAATWLSKMGFKPQDLSAKLLSGGWKKRLKVAEQLIQAPDLLLLDEPTNHLDLEGILWLEKFLPREVSSYLIVSHDRYFLQNMVNRVIEINPVYPNGLFSIDGSYANFLEKKEDFLRGQIELERSLASKARRETEWLAKSPKARTTKAKSRVEGALELQKELKEVGRRNLEKRAGLDFVATERETRKLLVAKNISKEIGGRPLFHHLDFILSPGTRMGLMGPNGCGKTTLLRILAEEILPDQGTLKKAEDLKIVYFDQHRSQLPDEITLKEALSPKGDFVSFHGQMIHVNGWCKRFLFSPDILDMPIGSLSGGERARISIAHLMLQPADLLLLDEPTNDLDIPTLETLEESLLEFPGAVVLITHDRCMLDRICTTFLALGDLKNSQLFPDYAQWEASLKSARDEKKTGGEKKREAKPSKAKLSYAEKKEVEQIEAKILQLEEEVRKLNGALEDPAISENVEKLQSLCTEIGLAENQIEQLYLRWDELEKKLL